MIDVRKVNLDISFRYSDIILFDLWYMIVLCASY